MENPQLGLLNKFYGFVHQAVKEQCEKEREGYSSVFESFEAFCSRQKETATKMAQDYVNECSHAFNLILKNCSTHHDQQAVEELIQGANRFIATMDELKPENSILNDYFGYSPELLEKIYQVGMHSFEQGKNEEAGKIFSFLILLDPGYSACWVMLGITFKREKHWEKGLDALKIAMEIDEHNPVAYVHAASCYKELGRQQEAKEALNIALKEIVNHPEYKDLEKLARIEQGSL